MPPNVHRVMLAGLEWAGVWLGIGAGVKRA